MVDGGKNLPDIHNDSPFHHFWQKILYYARIFRQLLYPDSDMMSTETQEKCGNHGISRLSNENFIFCKNMVDKPAGT